VGDHGIVAPFSNPAFGLPRASESTPLLDGANDDLDEVISHGYASQVEVDLLIFDFREDIAQGRLAYLEIKVVKMKRFDLLTERRRIENGFEFPL
jgi:hypothetical protein